MAVDHWFPLLSVWVGTGSGTLSGDNEQGDRYSDRVF